VVRKGLRLLSQNRNHPKRKLFITNKKEELLGGLKNIRGKGFSGHDADI